MRGGQGNVFASDDGEKMFRAVCVHERVRPGENDIHASAIAFDEIKAEQFATFHGERFIGESLAQIR